MINGKKKEASGCFILFAAIPILIYLIVFVLGGCVSHIKTGHIKMGIASKPEFFEEKD